MVLSFCFIPLLLFQMSSFSEQLSAGFPTSEAEYMRLRDGMMKKERVFEGRNWNFTPDEKVVDGYLGFLKSQEKRRTELTGLPASLPMQDSMEEVQKTDVYKALLRLPKGGNLHTHEDHQLSRKKLLDIVWDCPDFKYLFVIDPNSNHPEAGNMDFYINAPQSSERTWINVKSKGIKKEDILKKVTLISLMTDKARARPTDASLRWTLINPLWQRAATQLTSNVVVKRKYLKAIMDQSLSEGITYIESRRSFGMDLPMYELDRSGGHAKTFGKKSIDDDYEKEVTIAIEVEEAFKKEHPEFMGFKRISYAVRSLNINLFETTRDNTLRLHRKYPDHVIGFDAVAEEDSGYSTLHFLKQYLALSDGSGESEIALFLHAAETSWPEDMTTSNADDDLVSTLANSYDALLLKAKRIGHGKGFLKKPYLLKILKDSKVAVEVCPLSNQILGMDVDLRNHFGQSLHKAGIPIVLAPDDPGTFGFDKVTLDWYVAYTAWGLDLGDLKKFALNSLIYTGMKVEEQKKAIDSWQASWLKYITELKREACVKKYKEIQKKENRRIKFATSLPSSGPHSTKVHVYGRNLEAAICKRVRCKLGAHPEFTGTYVSDTELICIVPQIASITQKESLPLTISLGNKKFLETGFNFEYDPSNTNTG